MKENEMTMVWNLIAFIWNFRKFSIFQLWLVYAIHEWL